jgi:hypothetical protein
MMTRIKLDKADSAVKRFVRSLRVKAGEVELELNGRVVCRIIPPLEMTTEEKKTLAEDARKLIRRSQERNKGVPARVIEREVRKAVEEVRRPSK